MDIFRVTRKGLRLMQAHPAATRREKMRKPNPKIDRDAPAWRIASLWGSPSKFARAIGKTPSTVQRWLESGIIPAEHHPAIAEAARRDRKGLRPADFVDQRAFARPAPQAAEAMA
jgi:DNA-binding transcriptional regulator YdaS (Cro superfamily)